MEMHHPLTERQKLILALIVREYSQSAQPIGSSKLLEKYALEISSATIRNEMLALAEMGYLKQPHTSAGRTPTEEGYRFFVSQLMGQNELSLSTKQTIAHQFYQVKEGVDQWMRLAASVLANQSKAAALVTAPHATQTRFKHVELISIRGRQVLMVLVLAGGDVRQQILTLYEPVTQGMLSLTANAITERCQGLNQEGIEAMRTQFDPLGSDIIKMISDLMQSTDRTLAGEIYRDGLIHMLAEPEFAEPEAARKALRVLEERPLLEDLLSQTVLRADIGDVQVLIGGEGNWEELSDCSIVLARYGVPDMATGMVGVLGPMRMSYGRSISAVRYIAELLSEMIEETHTES